jgi:hypothetical protein
MIRSVIAKRRKRKSGMILLHSTFYSIILGEYYEEYVYIMNKF